MAQTSFVGTCLTMDPGTGAIVMTGCSPPPETRDFHANETWYTMFEVDADFEVTVEEDDDPDECVFAKPSPPS